MQRILVVAPNWIGDALMAQPLLARLREKNAKVDVLAPEWVAPVARRMAEVDEVITAPFRHGPLQLSERWKLGRKLKRRGYDEAIVLYHNTDLVPEAPATFEEIPGICAALAGITNCVGVPGGGDGADPYHQYPFLSATGGYIFGFADGVYDPTDVGLDSEGAIAGGQFLEQLVEDGVVGSVNYGDAKNLFLEGVQPFWITGPWELGALNDQDAVNWSAAKIPTIAGGTPSPFIGVQAFFLSAFSENKVVARSFLLDYVATPDVMQALYDADPRTPVFLPLIETLADDPIVSVFSASAADGQPIPNIPEMGSVWGAWGDNMLLLRNGELDAETALTNAATAVREAISG